MLDRRQLLGAAVTAPALQISSVGRILERLAGTTGSPAEIARDEDFWREVQTAFTVDRSLVNLNNGGVSPSPRFVHDALTRQLEVSNQIPAYHMWRIQEPQKEAVRKRLAREWGVDAEEIALTRNASESLQICQFGIDLEPGDEVLTTEHDYPRMITTFRQRERRDGIVLRQFPVATPNGDPAEVVRDFERHVTERTRMILACHMINLTGQILPVREITAIGRSRGIPVVIDGAHALAHFDFRLDELDVDYYATSLHKWLFAPIGTGLLYVRRDLIAGTWPLMAAADTQDDDIRKFEEIGTHPAAQLLAIGEALTFHQGLGAARKAARLVYLRDMWAKRLAVNERVVLNTSLAPGHACGIANFRVEGLDTEELARWLWREHRIFTVAVRHANVDGIRVSPSVYTTPEELERFCEAVEHAIAHGLPA
jgi:isopenicillin-N epimerase